jgi:hypothetical protein
MRRHFLQKRHASPDCWCGCPEESHYLREGAFGSPVTLPSDDLGVGLACHTCEDTFFAAFRDTFARISERQERDDNNALTEAERIAVAKLGINPPPQKPS